MVCWTLVTLALATLPLLVRALEERPHVVLIVADDLGWDDVSLHGSSQVLTPNLDLLAARGVSLQRYYSHPVCSPSRAALMTGRYSHVTGMQGYPLTNGESRAVPASMRLLPEHLRDAGYSTHLVGKWHLGHARPRDLPTSRGFHTHFGHRGGYIDYYEYLLEETWDSGVVAGLDLYRNSKPAWDVTGYITDIYTQEAKHVINTHNSSKPLFLMVGHNAPHCGGTAAAALQAPPYVVRGQRHITSPVRRVFAAMVKKLDDSVGEIVNSLEDKGILNDTVIIFISDNGAIQQGESRNYGSNWPLRGEKTSPFEGGIHVVGLMWAASMANVNSHVWDGLMHVSDWLPTILGAAGLPIPDDIDGVNQWQNILTNGNSSREEIYEVDDYNGFGAVIVDSYKLVNGSVIRSASNYEGGDLRGVTGELPSYEDALKQSAVHSVFEKRGETVDLDSINRIRDRLRVNCGKKPENICFPSVEAACLYDLATDPCEARDISAERPELVLTLLRRLETQKRRTLPRTVPLFRDPRANPNLHNYTWTTWLDDPLNCELAV